MVWLKVLSAWEELLRIYCISSRVLVTSAQSFAKSRLRTVCTIALVLALKRWCLNNPPFVLNSNLTPFLTLSNAISSMTGKYKANKRGVRTQPCLVPLETMNELDNSPLHLTEAIILWWKNIMTLSIFIEIPNCLWKTQRVSMETVSKALVKSTKAIKRPLLCSNTFYRSCFKLKIMFTVILPDWKPQWDSVKSELARSWVCLKWHCQEFSWQHTKRRCCYGCHICICWLLCL